MCFYKRVRKVGLIGRRITGNWVEKNGLTAHVARVRNLNDKKQPDYSREI